MFTTPTTTTTATTASPTAPLPKRETTAPSDLPASATLAAPDSGQDPAPASQPSAPASTNQLKLVVAKAQTSLLYTYTLVDKVTGLVVAELPHQVAQANAAKPDYTAGGVIDTRV